MTARSQRGGLQTAVLTALAIGVAVIVGTLSMNKGIEQGSGGYPDEATEEYGRRLLRDTALYIGPNHDDPAMRYSGTNMACASCHLETGTKPGTLSLLPSAPKYPRFSGRDGGVRDLRDRINGCMQRSMNGRPFPRDSVELMAMERYILGLNAQYEAMGASRRMPDEQAAFAEPDRASDPAAGKLVYESRCQVCHGADGLGLRATANPANGYLFPPLWGPESYNNGAGMNRVLTAAMFIKARMPLGQADLTDDEAYDVSAYINSQPRPIKANLEVDFPDRTHKRIDSPYGPYADDFPHEQHKYGPFQPIRDYYESLKDGQ
ncbi:MAG: c-type cytochrome [Gammaproteobacteria bacterium]|nr:c-type cytochrome [Gammaproteobacteria bacterium]